MPPPSRLVVRVALVALLAGLLSTQLDYVPFSDTAEYADCVVDAVRLRDPALLTCASHPTYAYFAALALGQLVAPAVPAAFLFVNLVLAGVFLSFFLGLLDRIAPGDRWLALVGGAGLVLQPVVLTDWIQFSADTGVTLFALPFLWAVATRRPLAATLLGCGLVGAKETGWVVFGLAVLASAVLDRRRGFSAVLRGHAWAVVPALSVGAWLAWRGASVGGAEGGVLWHGVGGEEIVAAASSGGTVGRLLATHVANLAVLQFGWVVAPFAVWSGWTRVRAAWAGSDAPLDRLGGQLVVVLLTVPVLAALPILHAPPRYSAFLLPLIWLAGLDGLVRLLPRGAGLAVGVVTCALWGTACFRSWDPVSRWVFGTFPFGTHSLYYMTSIAEDWPGPGEDQLAYNLEFFYLPRLVDVALSDLRPPANALIVYPPNAAWRVTHRLDAETHLRTLSHDGAYVAQVLGEVVNPYHPDTSVLYGFEMANGVWPGFRAFLEERATVNGSIRYELDGYELIVHLANGARRPRASDQVDSPAP